MQRDKGEPLTDLSEEHLWTIAESAIEDGFVSHHFRSYEYFIRYGLAELVKSLSPQEIKTKYGTLVLKFEDVSIGSPRIVEVDGMVRENITPSECRLRNLTYEAPIYVKMSLIIDGRVIVPSEKVHIGSIPVMVRSSICPLSKLTKEDLMRIGEDPLDPGGYFIINGSERVIVAIEDLAPNRTLVTIKEGNEGAPQYSAVVLSSVFGRQSKIELLYKPGGAVKAFFSRIYKGIPVIILLRALGMTRDEKIVNLVSNRRDVQELLEQSFIEAEGIETPQDALRYIGNRVAFGYAEEFRVQRAEQMIDTMLLPHIGTTSDRGCRYKKAVYLCDMLGRLLETSVGLRKPSDKDHYANKRLKLAAPLLMELYRVALTRLLRDIKYQLERVVATRQPINLSTFVRSNILNNIVRHSFATGNWPGGRVGVTQLLNRTNYLATISHLRRVQSPLSRGQPHFEARDLHGTHWGRICPVETPEGSNSGLVKNLAFGADVTVTLPSGVKKDLREKLWSLGVISTVVTEEEGRGGKRRTYNTKVYVDGELVGFHERGEELVRQLKEARRNGEISPMVSVYYEKYEHLTEVEVFTDEGRVTRSLIIVEKGVPKISLQLVETVKEGTTKFRDLLDMGVIEYIDASEEENCLVALTPKSLTPSHTHLEISPLLMFGAVASMIPFSDHNQSPRNVYEAAMAKQALGVPALNFNLRTDSRLHLLIHPQKPIVNTVTTKLIGIDKRPIGQNLVVAVMTGMGYNMEDAIVLNQGAVARGVGLSMSYRTYEVEAMQYRGGEKDRIIIPEPGTRGYKGEQYYRVLDSDGLAHIESEVSGGTVIVGMISPPRFMEEYVRASAREMVWRDSSETVRPSEAGVVDNIWISRNEDGNKLVKARVRSLCFAEIGDKFASRHGQKGVVGMLIPHEDMPYTASGIVPDLIINPHAFPSRMTVGQLIESLAGKVGSVKATDVDGTPFIGKSLDELRSELEALGFRSGGTEVMYDGLTGRRFEVEVYVGVVYYQRLHHIVRDKIHARSRGQVQLLTRQPTEGRSRGGGLKFGEMERDCLIAYGASYLLLDRLLEQSDRYTVYFCQKCGLPAYNDLRQEKILCPVHGKEGEVRPVTLSYAFYLLLNELISMGIYPKVVLEEMEGS
ncbi:MAG: DNA-directed RNA polymerase subunit B [Aigarchaeota archaeon]|nr:DNA-directed RNA polymerase subunit B [Aigarchaeota archaeon]MDW8092993.1 DNA-directed RNA polymerase subunit B [Nitrososphaerota archaeon]